MGQLSKTMRGSKSLDTVECYALHRKVAAEWFEEYEEYVRLMAGLTPSSPLAVLRNRFPYDVDAKHQWVVWSLNGSFTDDAAALVRHETGHTPTVLFENAFQDRSVPGIRHLHARV